MQLRPSAAALALGLLVVQGAVAFSMAPAPEVGAPGANVRQHNREILVELASNPYYDPTAPNVVTTGSPANLVTVVVPAATAIEMHLDHLDQYGISLSSGGGIGGSDPADPTVEPAWPQVGQFLFMERGFVAQPHNAQCPSLLPLTPQEYKAKTGQDWPGGATAGEHNYTAGLLTSDVSKDSYISATKKQTNFLYRWDVDNDTDPLSRPPGQSEDEWFYGGAFNAGWVLEAVGWVDYLCRKDATLVYHDSVVEPRVARVG